MIHKGYIHALSGLLLLLILSCQDTTDSTGEVKTEQTTYAQCGTPFNGVPDPEDVVMYEVNLRAFSPGGDLQGVIDRLDEIRALGVNVIWLMPIHPIGLEKTVNSPYCVRDFKAVNPEFGTLSDLRRLTDEAHARGMAVIMDWVANHTAWDTDWIENEGWYTTDSNGNIVHPPGTNWLDVADLNYGNQDMREAMLDAMLYWLYTANVDGFRCDYADGVPADFWSNVASEIRSIEGRDFILFAEGARNDHFSSGFDLAFGWDFYDALKRSFAGQSVEELYAAHDREYTGIPQGKNWIRFTTNHDESAWDATPVSFFGGTAGATTASGIAIFTGGAPLIYGSQEVGASTNIPFFSNSVIDWDANQDMKQDYQDMLTFYNAPEVARTGENALYRDADVVCLEKEKDGDRVLLIANIRNRQETLNIPVGLQGIWTDVLNAGERTIEASLVLEPYEILILD